MIVLLRTLLVTGTVFAGANAALALVAWLTWPIVRAGVSAASPATRARAAFAWRAMPTVGGVLLSVAVGLSFLRYEPVATGERLGLSLAAAAAFGLAMMAWSVGRLLRLAVVSERFAREVTAGQPTLRVAGTAEPVWVVDAPFPVVAVVGIRTPRLVVARCVVDRCTPDELAAMLAHEGAHAEAGDNLRRLWLQASVDGLSWTRRAASMARAWHDAAEEAADDRAAALGVGTVDLASALITVARLAPARRFTAWPVASCFYSGGGLERRVRRLLARPVASTGWGLGRVVWRAALVVAAAGALIVPATALALPLYVAAEWLVHALP